MQLSRRFRPLLPWNLRPRSGHHDARREGLQVDATGLIVINDVDRSTSEIPFQTGSFRRLRIDCRNAWNGHQRAHQQGLWKLRQLRSTDYLPGETFNWDFVSGDLEIIYAFAQDSGLSLRAAGNHRVQTVNSQPISAYYYRVVYKTSFLFQSWSIRGRFSRGGQRRPTNRVLPENIQLGRKVYLHPREGGGGSLT